MKYNQIFVASTMFVMVLVGVGCTTVDTDSGHILQNENKINIGALLPLTGSMSKAGQDVRVALEIASEDFKDKYPNINLVLEDDQFDPRRSVDAFHKLKQTNSPVAIIGPLNGSSIEAVRPLANNNKLLTMTPWGSANKIDQHLWKNSMEVTDEVKTLVEIVIQKMGHKKLSIIYMDNDFGLLNATEFERYVSYFGGELVFSEPILLG